MIRRIRLLLLRRAWKLVVLVHCGRPGLKTLDSGTLPFTIGLGTVPATRLSSVQGNFRVWVELPTVVPVPTELHAMTRVIRLVLHPLAVHWTTLLCWCLLKLTLTLGTEIWLGPRNCLKTRLRLSGLSLATFSV